MTNAGILTVWYMIVCTGITVHLASLTHSPFAETNVWLIKEQNPNNIFGDQIQSDRALDIDGFIRDRKDLLNNALNSSFGGGIVLNEKEARANTVIMTAKKDELDSGLSDPESFNPARHVFYSLNSTTNSKLFHILKKMPKGGILHIHEHAMCTADYLVSLTYWTDLWQRIIIKTNKIEEFRFSRKQPKNSNDSTWLLVKDVRAKIGDSAYNKHVRSMFTLYAPNLDPMTQFKDINDVWDHFSAIFVRVRTLLEYEPARRAFYKQAFKEIYEDGVQYVEIRAALSKAHDLDGNFYTEDESLQIYSDVINEFKSEYPKFIGAKFIYSINKFASNETVETYFETARRLHTKIPELLTGFDLVGQEDKAPPLQSYVELLSRLPDGLKFYFHAGETNWFGKVDENLIDAILLGTRRIGHGFALAKHPKLIDLVKGNDIAIEVNPISNQVLKLVYDIRNHPASTLFAQNVPIVISSDDPGFWEVSPLSHDFYFAFLGIASQYSDLRTLKQLALNSILYSSMKNFEKAEAVTKWQINWDAFIENLVQN